YPIGELHTISFQPFYSMQFGVGCRLIANITGGYPRGVLAAKIVAGSEKWWSGQYQCTGDDTVVMAQCWLIFIHRCALSNLKISGLFSYK
ncbi:MAG: hypothetical protein ACRCUF_21075, partial [Aeromonas sobria]